MISRLIKVAGAAIILGTLVGTGTANAFFIRVLSDGTIAGRIAVAQETLLKANSVEGKDEAKTKYYVLTGGGGNQEIRALIGVAMAANETALVTVTLEGMVFAQSGGARLEVYEGLGSDTAVTGMTETRLSGGMPGDTEAVFSVRGAVVTAANSALYSLAVEPQSLGVNANTGGSVTINVRRTVSGFSFGPTYRVPNAVSVISAIDDEVDQIVRPVASVDAGFMTFRSGIGVSNENKTASVGRINLGVVKAADLPTGVAAALGFVSRETGTVVRQATDALPQGDRPTLVASTRLGFDGDVSFAESVFLGTGPDNNRCATNSFTLTVEEDGVLSWKTGDDRAMAAQVGGNKYLCIQVDGETAIPETGSYSVTIDNTGLDDAAYPPGDEVFQLGNIERDGATVYIPFLSTFDGYNHRVVLENRGSSAITYEMEFTTESGVTATPGDDASGSLPANSVTTISASDLVTLSGGGRTSVTITSETSSSNLGVATVLVNIGDGSTDTVKYQ